MNYFRTITGKNFDSLLEKIGIQGTQVKYRDLLIVPNPLVSHEGITPVGGFTHPVSDMEAVDTWTVSVQIEQFQSLLSAYRPQATPETQKFYTLEFALSARQPWFLKPEGASEFWKMQSTGQGRREATRYVWKLSLLGV